MAEGIQFVCTSCGNAIQAWSDGNPFYIDEAGNKKYAYHPNHAELEKCVAIDLPHLCLQCGNTVKIDSRLASRVCPDCNSENVVSTFGLEGVKCPNCKDGRFARDNEFYCIS